jgi:hypothetical protein
MLTGSPRGRVGTYRRAVLSQELLLNLSTMLVEENHTIAGLDRHTYQRIAFCLRENEKEITPSAETNREASAEDVKFRLPQADCNARSGPEVN